MSSCLNSWDPTSRIDSLQSTPSSSEESLSSKPWKENSLPKKYSTVFSFLTILDSLLINNVRSTTLCFVLLPLRFRSPLTPLLPLRGCLSGCEVEPALLQSQKAQSRSHCRPRSVSHRSALCRYLVHQPQRAISDSLNPMRSLFRDVHDSRLVDNVANHLSSLLHLKNHEDHQVFLLRLRWATSQDLQATSGCVYFHDDRGFFSARSELASPHYSRSLVPLSLL